MPSSSGGAKSTSVMVDSPSPVDQIDMGKCNLEAGDRVKLDALLRSYADCFAANPKNPSTTTVTQHVINTGDAKPIKLPPYRVARQHEKFIREEIEQLLKNGQIEKSSSPWSFPVVVVLKKDGSLRFCIDYRKLNSVTKKDGYPVPNVGELLDCLHGSTVFSTLDLASGYWQVMVSEEDCEKTAFVTKYGLYQWRTMPFGLATAPATFVRLMEEVLGDLRWKCVIVYFDDITVYSKSVEKHLVHLSQVFDRLRAARLQAKASKCTFGTDMISFLGYQVSAAGIQPDPAKVVAIKHFPHPHDVTSVKSFLGLANFYRIFVRGYSNIARPLNGLLCKGVEFTWDEQCEKAFQQLKQGLMQSPILATADFDLPFILYTDASKYALGGILGQVQDNKSRVVAYASRTLNKHELNYSVSEKEALAIVWAVNHWQHYLLGDKQFTIITDHHPLTGLKTIKDLHGRLGRWSLQLQHYNFVVQYRAGDKNQVDALSRIELATTGDLEHYTESSSKPLQSIGELLCPERMETYLVVSSFALTRQMQAVELSEPGDSSSEVGSDDDSDGADEEKYNEPQSPIIAFVVGDRVLVSGLVEAGPYTITRRTTPVDYEMQLDSDSSIVITVGIDQLTHYYDDFRRMDEGKQADLVLPAVEQFNSAQRQDDEWEPLIAYLESGTIPPNAQAAHLVQQRSVQFAVDSNQSLVHLPGTSHSHCGDSVSAVGCLVVPRQLRPTVLTAMHDCPLSGHMGVKKTLSRLVHRFWWPKMAADVQRWISSCTLCSRRKTPKSVDKPIRSILPGQSIGYSAPFAELVVDTLGPLTKTKRRNQYCVIFCDRLTRWPEAFAVSNQRAKTVAKLIVNEIIPRYGVPRTLLSDQGSNYLSKLCRQVYKEMGIRKLQTSAYYPQGNGLVERFNHTLVNMLAMYTNDKQNDWDEWLPHVLFAYRAAKHASTGYSPFYMLHGFEPRYPIDVLQNDQMDYANYHEWVQQAVSSIKSAHAAAQQNLLKVDTKLAGINISRKPLRVYQPGDLVLIYHPKGDEKLPLKLQLRWRGPYEILRQRGPLTYTVRVKPGVDVGRQRKRRMTINVLRIKPYTTRPDELEVDESSQLAN